MGTPLKVMAGALVPTGQGVYTHATAIGPPPLAASALAAPAAVNGAPN